MVDTSSFLQKPAPIPVPSPVPYYGAMPDLEVETLDTVPCGRVALWLGLLRHMRVREIVDRLLPTEAEITHGAVAEALVLNRLIGPRPLYRVEEWARSEDVQALTGIDASKLNDDRLGRTLDALAMRATDIHAEVTACVVATFGLRVTDVNYDTTSVYFEGDYEDSELAALGHNKDGKPDHLQVKLALATCGDGQVPLAHLTVPGNTGDVVTVPAALKALQAQVPITNVVISGDAVMWSQRNMDEVAHAGGVFVGPIAMIPTVEKWVLEACPDIPIEVKLARSREPVLYRACVVGRFAVDGVKDAGTRIVVFDERRAQEEARERSRALERYDAALQHEASRLNTRARKNKEPRALAEIGQALGKLAKRHGLASRYVDTDLEGTPGSFTLRWTRNEKKLAEAVKRDGKWPLVTNFKAASDQELCAWAVRRYKRHGLVERDMHLTKGPLRVRPLFVQNDERIVGLIVITVLALVALTLMERAARKVLQPRDAKGPVVAKLEAAVSRVAATTIRIQPFGKVVRCVANYGPRLQSLLHGLPWYPEIRSLLAQAREVSMQV